MKDNQHQPPEPTDEELLRDLRGEDQEKKSRALATLHERYAEKLRRYVATRQSKTLRRKVGVSDIIQSVFKDLARPSVKPTGNDAWKLLVCIARRKYISRYQQYAAEKRNFKKEISIEDAELKIGFDPTSKLPGQDSSFSPTEEILETLSRLIQASNLLKPSLKDLFRLYILHGGQGIAEIAKKLCISQRTAEAHLATLKVIFSRFAGLCPSCHRQTEGVPKSESVACNLCGHTWPKKDESIARLLLIRCRESAD